MNGSHSQVKTWCEYTIINFSDTHSLPGTTGWQKKKCKFISRKILQQRLMLASLVNLYHLCVARISLTNRHAKITNQLIRTLYKREHFTEACWGKNDLGIYSMFQIIQQIMHYGNMLCLLVSETILYGRLEIMTIKKS